MFWCISHHLHGERNVFLIQNHLISQSRVYRIYRIGNEQYDRDSRVNNNNNNVKRQTDVFEIGVTTWLDRLRFILSIKKMNLEKDKVHQPKKTSENIQILLTSFHPHMCTAMGRLLPSIESSQSAIEIQFDLI
jgi:hypothetical protein